MIINFSAFVLIGLILEILGAIFLAYGLIISKTKAIELGVSRLCGDSDEENLQLPKVKDRIKQSRNAKIGISFFVIGFLFQIIGTWQSYNYYIVEFDPSIFENVFSLDFINSNVGAFSLLFSLIVACSTVFYVILTRRLVAETKIMRKHQTDPHISLTIKPRKYSINSIDMIIENIGSGISNNLEFSLNRDFIYRKGRKLSELNLFKKGLSYLAPNQKVEFFFTDIADDVVEKSEEPLIITVKYKDFRGQSFSNDFIIDFSEYLGLAQRGKPPLYQISDELSKIKTCLDKVSLSIAKFGKED